MLKQSPVKVLGKLAGRFSRFPVLLKFLDAHDKLSIQVHPKDGQTDFIPAGESGKTEAWIVLESGPTSRIYAGLKPGTTRDDLSALGSEKVEDLLSSFVPTPGDAVFVKSGTVHSLNDMVVFEVQENSDVTFRLYDWGHVDPKTGKPRPLQVQQAMACIDLGQVAVGPVAPVVEEERLYGESDSFIVNISRCGAIQDNPRSQCAADTARVLIGIVGEGELEHSGTHYPVVRGDVVLLPAAVGACPYKPRGAVSLLEVALPE